MKTLFNVECISSRVVSLEPLGEKDEAMLLTLYILDGEFKGNIIKTGTRRFSYLRLLDVALHSRIGCKGVIEMEHEGIIVNNVLQGTVIENSIIR